MIDDIIKSTKEGIVERLSSPLIGSFVVAWCLWNYKFIVILFSMATVTQTFELINKIAFPNTKTIIIKGIILPLLTSLFYLFIYPYPARVIYAFNLIQHRRNNEKRQLIENETLLSVEESRKIRSEIILIERKHKEEVDKLNEEISKLKNVIDSINENTNNKNDAIKMDSEVQKSKNTIFNIDNNAKDENKLNLIKREYNISEKCLILLNIIESNGGVSDERNIIDKSGLPRTEAETYLSELERNGLVNRNYSQENRKYMYELTHNGLRIILNRKSNNYVNNM